MVKDGRLNEASSSLEKAAKECVDAFSKCKVAEDGNAFKLAKLGAAFTQFPLSRTHDERKSMCCLFLLCKYVSRLKRIYVVIHGVGNII
jgi:hypothetical protein